MNNLSFSVEVVPVYRIKGDTKNFRTYPAVARRMAWKIIMSKYGNGHNEDDEWCMPLNEPKNYICDCSAPKYIEDFLGDMSNVEGYINCPVHDRLSGYLRRLHTRLAAYLVLRYPMPRYAHAEIGVDKE